MESPAQEGQSSKRVRTRKRDHEPLPTPKMSYSATVAGDAQTGIHNDMNDKVDDEDTAIEEGDIQPTEEAGGGINLSQNFKNKLDNQWAKAVVVKLLGRKIGFRLLHLRSQSMWRPKGQMKLVDLENDYFLVNRAVVWIRLLELPIARYHLRILHALGNLIGMMVHIDEATLQMHRGKFARLLVDVDLSSPLRHSITHAISACPQCPREAMETIIPSDSENQVGKTTQTPELGGPPSNEKPQTDHPFGYDPWTQVQRRLPKPTMQWSSLHKQRPTLQRLAQSERDAEVTRGGSRFALLAEEDSTPKETAAF
ncbi:hypothetical protein K2173_012178 [Erythroxylum novogranatense]|uniref:DUF4283 domain-containing protein n=1 Tax=Erythroxylum novogranatense TaxID=1862640 RepID=A0AAV8SS17_9ROSI|nr:hypothetical protein K2173_012178 [Erythroxylum novogranatense]